MSPPMERAAENWAAISARWRMGGVRGHEAELDLAGHVEVALHALFFFVDALVEAGIGDARWRPGRRGC